MVSWSLKVYVFISSLLAGVFGSRLDPDCPRHRGLPDGLSRTENRFRDRAIYRLDLRNAIKGYIPNKEYRFRVQTTVRKVKFNDATVVIDAVDERCGSGSWVTDTDELYSPKGCPSIVTTQQKQPMGRAYFKWIAPSCGCVHFRVRVHVNATYYIDDETVRNGPLARTICPKAGSVKEPVTEHPPTTTVLPGVLTRNDRLRLLCDVTKEHNVEDVIKNEDFMFKRTMSTLSRFELDRLNIAVERRHLEILNCCDLDNELDKSECFGDIRRIRIDIFCGSGEPDIPLTKARYDWIKQRQPECCPQIGEARYRCFNHTLYEEEMMKDGHGHHRSIDMDDFDPVNYVEDYPKAEEIRTKLFKNQKQSTKTDDSLTEKNVQTKNVESLHVKSQNTDSKIGNGNSDKSADDIEESTKEDEKENDDNEQQKSRDDNANSDVRHDDEGDSDETGELKDETKYDDVKNKNLSIDECCMNGIDAGTRVVAEGFDGCFKMADKFHSFFTKWNRKCDRHFVVCCMRVIDGDTFEVPKFQNLRKLYLLHKHTCYHGNISSEELNTQLDTKTTPSSLELLNLKNEKLRLKQLEINNQNEIIKLKGADGHTKPFHDTLISLGSKHKIRQFSKHRRRKYGKQNKTDILKRKEFEFKNPNHVRKRIHRKWLV